MEVYKKYEREANKYYLYYQLMREVILLASLINLFVRKDLETTLLFFFVTICMVDFLRLILLKNIVDGINYVNYCKERGEDVICCWKKGSEVAVFEYSRRIDVGEYVWMFKPKGYSSPQRKLIADLSDKIDDMLDS